MGKMFPELKSSPVITRYQGGEPVLSKKDIPYDGVITGFGKINGIHADC